MVRKVLRGYKTQFKKKKNHHKSTPARKALDIQQLPGENWMTAALKSIACRHYPAQCGSEEAKKKKCSGTPVKHKKSGTLYLGGKYCKCSLPYTIHQPSIQVHSRCKNLTKHTHCQRFWNCPHSFRTRDESLCRRWPPMSPLTISGKTRKWSPRPNSRPLRGWHKSNLDTWLHPFVGLPKWAAATTYTLHAALGLRRSVDRV